MECDGLPAGTRYRSLDPLVVSLHQHDFTVRALRRLLAALLGGVVLPANLLAAMPGCGSHHELNTAADMAHANVHAAHAVSSGAGSESRDESVDLEVTASEQSDRQHGHSSPASPYGQLCSVSMTCIGAALLGGTTAGPRATHHEGAVASSFRTRPSFPIAPETPPPRA